MSVAVKRLPATGHLTAPFQCGTSLGRGVDAINFGHNRAVMVPRAIALGAPYAATAITGTGQAGLPMVELASAVSVPVGKQTLALQSTAERQSGNRRFSFFSFPPFQRQKNRVVQFDYPLPSLFPGRKRDSPTPIFSLSLVGPRESFPRSSPTRRKAHAQPNLPAARPAPPRPSAAETFADDVSVWPRGLCFARLCLNVAVVAVLAGAAWRWQTPLAPLAPLALSSARMRAACLLLLLLPLSLQAPPLRQGKKPRTAPTQAGTGI